MEECFMQPLHIVLLIAACVFATVTSPQAKQTCTSDDSAQAERNFDHVKNWADVYESFRRYGQCDDGSVAEAYDDKIVGLLVSNWESVGELAQLAQSDPVFERFVIKHIDTLMSPDQATAIIANATKRCPTDAKTICLKIAQKAQNPG
jgi:hypothetical protein